MMPESLKDIAELPETQSPTVRFRLKWDTGTAEVAESHRTVLGPCFFTFYVVYAL